jgi:Asp-tRNA(Asn)/Glu-tRNA(Gln) amidotransferase A subunit family amidase
MTLVEYANRDATDLLQLLPTTQFSLTKPPRNSRGAQKRFPYTRIFNASGNPAISIPAGQDARGLPIGIQLVGQRGQDMKLLSVVERIADAFMRAPLSIPL